MKIFVHHKGDLYVWIGEAMNSTNDGDCAWYVEYYSVEQSEKKIRLASEFHEIIEWPDGKMRRRFVEARSPSRIAELHTASQAVRDPDCPNHGPDGTCRDCEPF